MLPRRNLAVVYAVRGRRGVEINRQNALAIADLCSISRRRAADRHVVCRCHRCRPMPRSRPEIEATRQALVSRGRRFVWHDMLADALAERCTRTAAGDLIVLVGAQGMNDAKKLLAAWLGCTLSATHLPPVRNARAKRSAPREAASVARQALRPWAAEGRSPSVEKER